MFIQNQITSLPNHLSKIKEMLSGSRKVYLTVSYILDSGVSILIGDLKNIIEDKGSVKLVCSSDMGITDPTAIKKLLDIGVEVKVYKLGEGTFHAKVWLSNKNNKWYCMVGSANCSKSAFIDNVEASLMIDTDSNIGGAIEQALMFFEYLWDSGKCFNVDYEFLNTWQKRENSKAIIKEKIEEIKISPEKQKVFDLLFSYCKDWIDIKKEQKQKDEFKESLWRGWYIIPDQGPINDFTMIRLRDIINVILSDDNYKSTGYFDISPRSASINKIINLTKNKFKRKELKMDLRDLFIRQEKNYLRRFGFAIHPLKNNNKEDEYKLVVTDLGIQFAKCNNIDSLKVLYSRNMLSYKWGNLCIFAFTLRLLQKFTFLTFDEFSLFIMHAYSEEEFNDIKDLILMYRGLPDAERKTFVTKVNRYFEQIKGPTARNVRGNYFKHAKHNMSAIGWMQGLQYKEKILKIIDNKIITEILKDFDVEE
ncbi:MAG: hypothetical protein DDT21_02691 [Syntrophomonadaceae bacterium]|nr:hypothetical protein [Bacillota bacterium]